MNKLEFIETLRYYLAALPEDERNELLRDYEAHFIYGQQNGKSETEIARELGDPLALAREAIGPDFLPPPPWSPSRRDIPRFIGVSILLFFLNVMFAIPVFASIWAAFIAICAATLSCFLAPVALVAETVLYGNYMPGKWFVAIGMVGIGMLLAVAAKSIGKWLVFITLNYAKWNYKTWRGSH
ncbi:HAAS signaling domain-containing protein [Cohnella silvisoli]|uniref:DUF1700 domain-containing protein n=1 Tax=Cohnella silvisoli TaxID=2873699 RepID=A0ABV1KPW8_9BACL|nr:DUF1700 domain-containing protein [Cohnella silvisoli]MCD9022198.1 DUF1700 domain-containing protein [Cohnella silvisoli]